MAERRRKSNFVIAALVVDDDHVVGTFPQRLQMRATGMSSLGSGEVGDS